MTETFEDKISAMTIHTYKYHREGIHGTAQYSTLLDVLVTLTGKDRFQLNDTVRASIASDARPARQIAAFRKTAFEQ